MADAFKRKMIGSFQGGSRKSRSSKNGPCRCCTKTKDKSVNTRLARTRLAVDTREEALEGEQVFRDERDEEEARWCSDVNCCGICGNCEHCTADGPEDVSRMDDVVWLALPKGEMVWRAHAWGWNHYIKPERLEVLRRMGHKGYRLLEGDDLIAPWTAELMLDANLLLCIKMDPEKHDNVEQLRKKFLEVGIDSMEDFFDSPI